MPTRYKITQKEVEQKFKEKGFKLIGKYVKSKQKVETKCNCGRIFYVRPNSIFKGNTKTCGHCNDPKIGDKFNKLTITKIIPSLTNGCSIECLCDCGNIWKGRSGLVISGNNKSCGHCNDPKVGDKFGRLTIIKVIPNLKGGNGCRIECICDCGNKWKGSIYYLISGRVKSCKCLLLEKNKERAIQKSIPQNYTESLYGKFPKIAKEWDYKKNYPLTPDKIKYGSKKKVWWICQICDYKWCASICSRSRNRGCPHCCKSKGEKETSRILDLLNIKYIEQKRFKECKNKHTLPFDFYLPNYNICIEYNGEQHYIPTDFSDRHDKKQGKLNLKQIKKHDSIKQRFCEKEDIKLIVIKYTQINKIEEILRKKLKTKEKY